MSESTSILLAVASKEGLAISEHFGHARSFLAYRVTPQQCRLLERSEVEHYCLGNHSSKSAMAQILETIRDCRAVFVTIDRAQLVSQLQIQAVLGKSTMRD